MFHLKLFSNFHIYLLAIGSLNFKHLCFTYPDRQYRPNFCNYQTAVSITVSYPERSHIKYAISGLSNCNTFDLYSSHQEISNSTYESFEEGNTFPLLDKKLFGLKKFTILKLLSLIVSCNLSSEFVGLKISLQFFIKISEENFHTVLRNVIEHLL
jgi:hypothetical protein